MRIGGRHRYQCVSIARFFRHQRIMMYLYLETCLHAWHAAVVYMVDIWNLVVRIAVIQLTRKMLRQLPFQGCWLSQNTSFTCFPTVQITIYVTTWVRNRSILFFPTRMFSTLFLGNVTPANIFSKQTHLCNCGCISISVFPPPCLLRSIMADLISLHQSFSHSAQIQCTLYKYPNIFPLSPYLIFF